MVSDGSKILTMTVPIPAVLSRGEAEVHFITNVKEAADIQTEVFPLRDLPAPLVRSANCRRLTWLVSCERDWTKLINDVMMWGERRPRHSHNGGRHTARHISINFLPDRIEVTPYLPVSAGGWAGLSIWRCPVHVGGVERKGQLVPNWQSRGPQPVWTSQTGHIHDTEHFREIRLCTRNFSMTRLFSLRKRKRNFNQEHSFFYS